MGPEGPQGEPGVGGAYTDFPEGVPANPAADVERLYAVDFNGITFLEQRDSAGRTLRLGRDCIAVAKVAETAGITKGQAVYISGASGNVRLIKLARADSRDTTPAIGVAMESGANNAFIRVINLGVLPGLDTSAYPEGDRVFLSGTTAGALVSVPLLAPHLTQRVGFCLRQHATAGELGIYPATAVSESAWLGIHAPMHASGGRDPLNVTALAGFSGNATEFLNGGGAWTTPAGGGGSGSPVGTILMYGGSAAPTGYLFCDGTAVSRTTYAALFTAIGTAYGSGDGSTTFNLPDLQQRFPLGKGAAQSLGATGGTFDHTHSFADTAPVTGTGTGSTDTGVTGTGTTGASGQLTTSGPTGTVTTQSGSNQTISSTSHTHTIATHTHTAPSLSVPSLTVNVTSLSATAAVDGTSGSANPPYQVVHFIIKT